MKKLLFAMLLILLTISQIFACGGDEPNQHFTTAYFLITKAKGVLVGNWDRVPARGVKSCSQGISGNLKKGEEVENFSITIN